MNEQLAMWKVYASHIITTPQMLTIIIVSLVLSLVFYLLFRKTTNIKSKVAFLHLHIAFIFLPFIFSALLWRCMMPVYSCSPKLIIYLVSGGASITFLMSIIALPYLYNWTSRSREIKEGHIREFVKKQSSNMNIQEPKIYATPELTPRAYSITNIRPSIFLSVGLCEILAKEEMEAVLLHELYHIQRKASFWRFSINMLKIFSPLATFITVNHSINQEEKEADQFAVIIQGTKRFLKSAKQKINKMNRKILSYS